MNLLLWLDTYILRHRWFWLCCYLALRGDDSEFEDLDKEWSKIESEWLD